MDIPFTPRGWLANRHLQTLSAALPYRRASAPANHQTLMIPLPKGTDCLRAEAFMQRQPRVAALLIHGVAGSSESPYMRRAADDLVRRGWHAVCLNLRGAGLGARTAQRLYHAGLTEDIDCAVASLMGHPLVTGVVLVGMSLGGQVALLTASRWGAGAPDGVRAVAAISAPVDLHNGCLALDDSRRPVYRNYILRGLVRNALRLQHYNPTSVPLSAVELRGLRRVRDYDNRVIAPMHGFASAEDYYNSVSCGPHLHAIRLPTLSIHADDDPVVVSNVVRPYIDRAGKSVTRIRTARGGHLGFAYGLDGHRPTWAMEQVIGFMERFQ